MSRRTSASRFSLSWVFVSYFAICGGIVFALAGLAGVLPRTELDPRAAGYLACGAGGLLGGFFAGRASRHFSVLEPALGGALVIGSVYALIKWTALGPLAFAFARDAIVRESLVLGGLAFGGGLSGALLGELSSRGTPSESAIRWLGMTVFLTVGALLAASIATSIVFADHALRDPDTLRRLWHEGHFGVSDDYLAMAVIVAIAGGGFLGGLAAQIAAPRRMLLVSLAGVFLTVFGILAGLFAYTGVLDQDALRGVAVVSGGAAVVGFIGAVLAWLWGRALGS